MGVLLNKINSPKDIKNLDKDELKELSKEIREFLIEKVSKTGGHLASNLGIVELTLALHRVFNTPEDKFIWDVGHQSYVHKIITGRKNEFDKLRQIDGISGFPKAIESEHDAFNTGHSSTSISIALGMAKARDIKNEDNFVIAVIGDGALTGGMAYEALDHAGKANTNIIVVLNDNEMSISKNVGGMPAYLSKIRTEPIYFKVKEDIDIILNKIPAIGKSAARALSMVKGSIKYMVMPGIVFEELGFTYIGPIDGHDVEEVTRTLQRAKNIKGPVLVHVLTQKGKGYKFAEENPDKFHGISPFKVETGETISKSDTNYSKEFGKELVRLAQNNEKIVTVSAAMPTGTGTNLFAGEFPKRFFDVGIAEQHAVTFSAGIAKNRLIPICAIYSSFFQRAYDQILHDVALPNLHVVFAIDRAGVVGEDGETHQGIYDMSFFRHIPNMTIMSPCDYTELRAMLKFAIEQHDGPVAIRYPRGSGQEKLISFEDIVYGKGVELSQGEDVAILAVGKMVQLAIDIKKVLEEHGKSVTLVNARFVKPIDEQLIEKVVGRCKNIFTIEDNIVVGGFGSGVLEFLSNKNICVKSKVFGLPDKPVEHGATVKLFKKYGLTAQNIANDILNILEEKGE